MAELRVLPRILLAAAAVACAAAPAAAKDPWWDLKWSYRREVTVSDVPKSGLAGEEVGVVTMPTGGLIRPDGRDLRVATARGEPVPDRLLMLGPGDQARVAFALRPPHTKYYVYFGNAQAPAADPLELRRGVLLETWQYRGGGIATMEEVRQAFARAGKLIGRDFRPNVFLGHNPFGPQNRLCSLFTGYLRCPERGEYLFATSSRDASFLLVDGKVVVANGGSHPPQSQAERQGKIDLAEGLHELKVYHVNTFADPVVMAAWQPPSGRKLWTIPEDAFAPIRVARSGPLERYGREVELDFLPEHAGETFMENKYFQRYVLRALVSGAALPIATGRDSGPAGQFRWDFGDGQSGTGGRCEHVYLSNGPVKVSLTARLAGQELTRTNTIYVTRPWDQVAINKLDALAEHARIVAGYDFAAADPQCLADAITLFERAEMPQAILKAGEALAQRDTAPAEALRDGMPIYAQTLVAKAKDPPRAVAALLKAAEMTDQPAVRASLTIQAGQIALAAGDGEKALGLFEHAVKSYAALAPAEAVRDARIGIGDVHRLRGDYEKALAAYQSAKPLVKDTFEKAVVRQGDLARHVEDYTRRGMFHDAADFLDRWEQEFPVEKLEGYSTLLRVRLELAQKRYAPAAEQAEGLVRVNPRSNYAADLLMLAFEAYKALGQDAPAREALQRLAKNYPESPLAAGAKKRLGSR